MTNGTLVMKVIKEYQNRSMKVLGCRFYFKMMEKFKKVPCFFEFFLFDVYIGGVLRKPGLV